MAGNSDSGEKTEKPTPKKLRDARKKGDVSKSRDVTNTVSLIFTLGVLYLVTSYASNKTINLMEQTYTNLGENFQHSLKTLGGESLELLLVITAAVLIPIAAFGMLVDFLQIGPVFSTEKIKPKMSNLNPVSGLKRMFGMDNLVEVLKSIIKTGILFLVGWIVIRALLNDIVYLPLSNPGNIVNTTWVLMLYLFGWTIGIFVLITALDAGYQKYSFMKKMRMSIRDIRQEHKDTEGDPLIKGHRRQTAQEWAQESASQSASDASVLVVNPTHVAIAISYDKEATPVPLVTAKGEDHIARTMREAAEDAGVPILRNQQLARKLLADADEGDLVPRALFDIVAEVILWSQSIKQRVEHERENRLVAWQGKTPATPGEDLTCYPSAR
ncbi:MAG: type III secretion system export apparatus subunit SctU [Gammaproteobacteria bacterium]|nr:type III secretion system export apparatus subunit SctU [Gammaproteobacteria bacterium]